MSGKLFTGAHDGSLRVWDITGIQDDTTFGRNKDENDEKETQKKEATKASKSQPSSGAAQKNKIMIGEDENMNAEENDYNY